jgi:hypothetical protein
MHAFACLNKIISTTLDSINLDYHKKFYYGRMNHHK